MKIAGLVTAAFALAVSPAAGQETTAAGADTKVVFPLDDKDIIPVLSSECSGKDIDTMKKCLSEGQASVAFLNAVSASIPRSSGPLIEKCRSLNADQETPALATKVCVEEAITDTFDVFTMAGSKDMVADPILRAILDEAPQGVSAEELLASAEAAQSAKAQELGLEFWGMTMYQKYR